MTAYTPDPTSHVLDANLASNPQRMLNGGKTGSRHAQGATGWVARSASGVCGCWGWVF